MRQAGVQAAESCAGLWQSRPTESDTPAFFYQMEVLQAIPIRRDDVLVHSNCKCTGEGLVKKLSGSLVV